MKKNLIVVDLHLQLLVNRWRHLAFPLGMQFSQRGAAECRGGFECGLLQGSYEQFYAYSHIATRLTTLFWEPALALEGLARELSGWLTSSLHLTR